MMIAQGSETRRRDSSDNRDGGWHHCAMIDDIQSDLTTHLAIFFGVSRLQHVSIETHEAGFDQKVGPAD